MTCGFTHCASGKRNLAIGLRSITPRRAFSSALSVPERAINAEPAYASPPCASARASKARGAFVLRSRAVPMIKNKSSVKHFVLSQVLLRPLLYLRGDKFGNDALELAIRAGLEECGSVSGELFTEQEGMISRDKNLSAWPFSQATVGHRNPSH